MIPVHQDSFYMPGDPATKTRGNCWSAALASILELPLEAVPNFVTINELGGPNWFWFSKEYVRLLGYDFRWVQVTSPPLNQHYIVSGISPRSIETDIIYHCVVYLNGKMVHDPHPEGTGLLTEDKSAKILVPNERGRY